MNRLARWWELLKLHVYWLTHPRVRITHVDETTSTITVSGPIPPFEVGQVIEYTSKPPRFGRFVAFLVDTVFWFLVLAAIALATQSCGKPPVQPTPTVDPITFVCGKLTECALVNDDRESQRGCRICGAMYLELIRVDYHLTDSEIFDVLGNYDCEEASKSYVLRRALECISE